jgi:recombination endonuclease VII
MKQDSISFPEPEEKTESLRPAQAAYRARKANGVCVHCGGVRNRDGYLVCSRCAENQTVRLREQGTRKARRRRAKFEALGYCIACGSPERLAPYRYCASCHSKNRVHQNKNRAKTLRAHRERWNRLSPEERMARNLKTTYGLSMDDYRKMVETQGGACGICRAAHKRLFVDHNHSTGAIRGLLCSRCNAFVGFIETSNGMLLTTVHEYLNHYQRLGAYRGNVRILRNQAWNKRKAQRSLEYRIA